MSDDEEQARRRAEGAKLDAYLARGIEIVGSYPGDRAGAAADATWKLDWVTPRLIGRDHVRYMLHGGRLVGVLTQPYDAVFDLAGDAWKLTELRAAGFDVDICVHCSPHFPGRTLAIIHYRSDEGTPDLHLPHG